MSTDKTEEKTAESADDKAHGDLIATAKRRFALAEAFEHDNREDALADWKFRAGDQWPADIKNERIADGRPVLVINKVLAPIRQVTNDQRQNRPSIKVHPVDDHADIETAKIYQGLIRHIEQDSGADVAYDTAFEGAVVGGFGYFRVVTEYVDPTGFVQKAKIVPIDNPFSVYFDPNSKLPDGSDAQWAFVITEVPKDDFIAEYGEAKLAGEGDWSSLGDAHGDWISKDAVRIAEYYYTTYKTITAVLLADDRVVDKEDLADQTKFAEIFPEDKFPGGVQPEYFLAERTVKIPVIKHCKLTSFEVLEETDWAGRWIPIIPVYGDKLIIDGKRILEGIVRHAKDPARMYNYMNSTAAETITLAPKAPFMVAEGQIPKQYEGMWKNANRKSYPYLIYKPTTVDQQLAPAPQRQVFEPPIQAMSQAAMFYADDVKGTTGVYDASMGAKSNETSGVAIQRRNMQAQTSNFHLIDNLTRSIRHCGRILVDLIPKIYDTPRAARIIGEEGQEEIVRINEEFKFKGATAHFRMGAGTYDVSVDTGPSFATKRQEAAQTQLELAKAAPQLMQVASDLIVRNLDIPGAQELAERLKKTLPPGIAEDDKNQKPIPPQVQAQLAQMDQMIAQLTQQVSEQAQVINTKQLEVESKERIEYAKLENALLIEKMKQQQSSLLETMRQSQAFAQGTVDRQVDAQLAELNQYQIQNQGHEAQEINQPAGEIPPGGEEY